MSLELDLIPYRKIIALNELKEVSDPILFERGNVPTSQGLLSTDIFGISVKERKNTWAYVRLNGPFLHPFIFKMLKRMNRNFDSIVAGTKYFKIVDGQLVEDEDGGTGLEFLYKNWDSLDFKKNASMMRNERVDVLWAHPKEVIFTEYWLIEPAFYRDVNLQSSGQGKISHHEINDKYSKLIRQASFLRRDSNFDFELNTTRSKMQETLVEVYDLSKSMIEKKHGMIRKSLLGKSIDYGARAVISAPKFDANRPEDMQVDFYHTGVPLATCCSLFTPFVLAWVKNFFQREVERLGNKYPVRNKKGEVQYVTLKSPELYFTEEYIKKQVDRFIFSYGDRFDPIKLPVDDDSFDGDVYLSFTGRFQKDGVPENESPLSQRPATWCDILYQAVIEITADKMVWITRYPLLDYFGMLPNKISVMSTHETVPMFIGGKVYPHYPNVQVNMPKDRIATYFIDTVVMSNLYLAGLGGDYDGDQVTIKGVFSQEANRESEAIMRSKAHILNIYGQNMRKTTNEGVQTLYMLTKRQSS